MKNESEQLECFSSTWLMFWLSEWLFHFQPNKIGWLHMFQLNFPLLLILHDVFIYSAICYYYSYNYQTITNRKQHLKHWKMLTKERQLQNESFSSKQHHTQQNPIETSINCVSTCPKVVMDWVLHHRIFRLCFQFRIILTSWVSSRWVPHAWYSKFEKHYSRILFLPYDLHDWIDRSRCVAVSSREQVDHGEISRTSYNIQQPMRKHTKL